MQTNRFQEIAIVYAQSQKTNSYAESQKAKQITSWHWNQAGQF